ncbi:MAG: hypothetical protein CM1200mP24_08020 [Gammaproteobacteria bacterium]|nr:MAG: hypothetical protein CM1200mP24_08020 [Gammaproteobacteria bacterium]
MSEKSLERFLEQVNRNEELKSTIENQLDSDGNISVDALIALGAEIGCEFTFEDLQRTAELSEEDLGKSVAGGYVIAGGGSVNLRRRFGFGNIGTTGTFDSRD